MKVKIFTECGTNIGLGHISRCSSLYDEVKSRGIDVEFIINGDIKKIDILNGLEVKFENWLSTEYLNDCIESSDYCIVDSYLADVELYDLISMKAKKALYIDDTARVNYPLGIVVNPSLNTYGMYYPKTNTNTYLLGKKFIILRTPFIDANRHTINEEVKEVIITMGGSDIRNLSPQIMKHICAKYPKIKFNVVVSDNFSNIELIKSTWLPNVELHYNVDAESMKNLMLQSDIAITAAGQTIYELLATKTPFIPIKIIENQSNNTNGLQNINANQIIIDYNDECIFEKLRNEFDSLINLEKRLKSIEVYRDSVDGLGRKRIVNILCSNR